MPRKNNTRHSLPFDRVTTETLLLALTSRRATSADVHVLNVESDHMTKHEVRDERADGLHRLLLIIPPRWVTETGVRTKKHEFR